jgi:hypothetical protein
MAEPLSDVHDEGADRGSRVVLEEQTTAGAQAAGHLVEEGVGAGDVVEDPHGRDGREGAVREREVVGVRLHEPRGGLPAGRPGGRAREFGEPAGVEVNPDVLPGDAAELGSEPPEPDAELQHPPRGAGPERDPHDPTLELRDPIPPGPFGAEIEPRVVADLLGSLRRGWGRRSSGRHGPGIGGERA